MHRRQLLSLAGASIGASLASPRLGAAQGQRLLRFVPHADLAVVDPVWTTAYVTRNHAYLVFDTLYGMDAAYNPQPQMVAGHAVEEDGRRWTLTLREGLAFHDGTPVLARDCVASIRRWGRRDDLGRTLLSITDELFAPDDRTIAFRLKRPFPLLPFVLGKTSGLVCAMMPARIAEGSPDKAFTEVVGSGPFRFRADERVAGDRVVYERFAAYRPREGAAASGTAGPKIAHLDRVEWKVISDASTAASALRAGEVDWYELPGADILPLLRRGRDIKVETLDPSGYIGSLRLNHLHGPAANREVRRAMVAAISQADVVMASAGTDPALWKAGVGFFCPDTPLANDAGLSALTGPRDKAALRGALQSAGLSGEKLVFMTPSDIQLNNSASEVAADALRQAGMNVDLQAMDWGTMLQRRNKKEPASQGGWHAYVAFNTGSDMLNPAVHPLLRGDGASGAYGWSEDPAIERLREAWFAAPDLAAQQAAARQLQEEAFGHVPYIPLGQVAQLTAYRGDLNGMPRGVPVFWGIRRG
ncbi:ABC transporter substrate-binding protein [Pararoseomonas indoligenes]|uniref:ABC transporter substrate-binding protein n=1 Tax=Roseomonas indoligenes TaxID=2820811 RepID=A0A940MX90_9PROT|nr:ABC transporter substrate-binding protein [Pararoseomonas indoligenes]MBP0495933.1 ABC transporter substrate-binding protein [Pararoseomonas indoligenes]